MELSISREQLDQVLEYQRCRESPHYFFGYLKTKDEHGLSKRKAYQAMGIRDFNAVPFPDHEYIRVVVDQIHNNQQILVFKSRQMLLTWIVCGYLLWDFLYNPARVNLVQCLDFNQAEDHLKNRIYHMYLNLPDWMQDIFGATRKEGEVYCPKTNSFLIALAQGGDKVRGYTASHLFMDEMAFQYKCADAYEAARPAIEGGGSFVGITTPNFKEWAWRLWDDDGSGDWFPLMSSVHDGYKTPFLAKDNENGIRALRLHFSAHPDRDAEWEAKERHRWRHRPWKFLMEYDINVEVVSGDRFFFEYDDRVHDDYTIVPLPDEPILRCWDFGFRHPAVVWMQYDPRKHRLLIFREELGREINLWDFAPHIIKITQDEFPNHEIIDFCDVAGRQRSTTGDYSEIGILESIFNIFPINDKFPKMLGFKIVKRFLSMRTEELPHFLIDPGGCPRMVEGLRGGISFKKEQTGELKKDEYAVNHDSIHAWDAAKYGCCNYPPLSLVLSEEEPEEVEVLADEESERLKQYLASMNKQKRPGRVGDFLMRRPV